MTNNLRDAANHRIAETEQHTPLADEGIYVASESTLYRLLKKAKQLSHRGRCKPKTHCKPQACVATAPNQVWSWDITYLPTSLKGQYFYLYMIMDIFSRKIVGFHVHEAESAEYASLLITQACFTEKIKKQQIVLHSDNGAPMKGLTMRATLEKLGVVPSFSRPSVSDDNPFSESLFKTLKYHPTFPRIHRFDDIAQARPKVRTVCDVVQHTASAQWFKVCNAESKTRGKR